MPVIDFSFAHSTHLFIFAFDPHQDPHCQDLSLKRTSKHAVSDLENLPKQTGLTWCRKLGTTLGSGKGHVPRNRNGTNSSWSSIECWPQDFRSSRARAPLAQFLVRLSGVLALMKIFVLFELPSFPSDLLKFIAKSQPSISPQSNSYLDISTHTQPQLHIMSVARFAPKMASAMASTSTKVARPMVRSSVKSSQRAFSGKRLPIFSSLPASIVNSRCH